MSPTLATSTGEKDVEQNTVLEAIHTTGAGDQKEIVLTHADSNDGDAALNAIKDLNGETTVITEEDEKRVLRKIDWHLMPMLCIVYGLNYLDKTTLSYASIMGLKPAIGLVGTDYQWLGSMFYIGYLVWEVSSGYDFEVHFLTICSFSQIACCKDYL